MISKRIDRAGKTSSFERLGHYVGLSQTEIVHGKLKKDYS